MLLGLLDLLLLRILLGWYVLDAVRNKDRRLDDIELAAVEDNKDLDNVPFLQMAFRCKIHSN